MQRRELPLLQPSFARRRRRHPVLVPKEEVSAGPPSASPAPGARVVAAGLVLRRRGPGRPGRVAAARGNLGWWWRSEDVAAAAAATAAAPDGRGVAAASGGGGGEAEVREEIVFHSEGNSSEYKREKWTVVIYNEHTIWHGYIDC